MVAIINDHTDNACTEYKTDVENAWRQMRNQQLQFYILWIRATDILGTSTDNIAKLLKDRLEQQEKDINSKLCSLVIQNSINMHCNGLYLLPNQMVTIKCKDGYYPSRDPKAKCKATKKSNAWHVTVLRKMLFPDHVMSLVNATVKILILETFKFFGKINNINVRTEIVKLVHGEIGGVVRTFLLIAMQ